MAISGDTFSTYLQESYIPRAISEIFWNSWWMNQPYFEIVPPERCPGGDNINILLDYSVSTNAEVYTQGAPMPDPDSLSSVRAYHTKDTFQASAKVYGDTLAKVRGVNATKVPLQPNQKAINTAIKNLVDLMSTTFLTDLQAQVDSSTAYSDASLSRSTYSIASYESAVGGALTLAALEDMLEAIQNTTYGIVPIEDLVWVCPRNQLTNLSRLQAGTSNYVINVDAQNSAAADAGRLIRLREYEGIPIFVVPDMTTSEFYLLRKSTTKIYLHDPIKVQPKDVAEYAEAWLCTAGANLVIEDPLRCGKLTGVTA